jgi:hypothetical protein
MNRSAFAISTVVAVGTIALFVLPGCGASPSEASQGSEINVHPTNFDEAKASLALISDLQKNNPEDPRALAALQAIQPALDKLNHLVARVEPKQGHLVSFYESAPGIINVSESGPVGSDRVLTGRKETSFVDLYGALAGGSEAPAALVEAEARRLAARTSPATQDDHAPGAVVAPSPAVPPAHASGSVGGAQESTGTTSEALTANDAAYFVQNCYRGGDYHACFPNWWNGGWADFHTKTSFFQTAAITGTVFVQGTYEGQVWFIDPVLKGQWGSWWAHSDSSTTCGWGLACGTWDYNIRHHRWDILWATNQEFDWSTEARWNCDYLDCDSP